MNGLTVVLLALGAAIALINFHYSALCTLAHRAREGRWPTTMPVGIPMIGTVLLVSAFFLATPYSGLAIAAALLALIDTGGPVSMLALARSRRRRRPQRQIAAS